MNNVRLEQSQITEIIASGKEVEETFNELRTNYLRYKEAYFMVPPNKPKNADVDANDWAITPSPSARNEVQGVKRLVDTSEMHVEVVEGTQSSKNSDKIERGLKRIVEVSGEGKKARLLSDAALAASLYGPVIVFANFYDDKIAASKNAKPYIIQHLEKQKIKSPASIEVLNAEECSFQNVDGMIVLFQRKYKLRGNQLKVRYGWIEGKPIKDNMEYVVRDIYTPEHRVIDVEGYGTVMAMETKLGCIPVGIGYAGGSELFYKPEEQINPFLFAKTKASLYERETSALTAIFTNMKMRGLLGPLFYIEGDTRKIDIQHKGGARFITTEGGGKASLIDDKIVDPMAFEILKLIDELNGQSTIYRQTLGENINAGTFSGLAMLSSAGKLPLVDTTRALEQAFSEIFDHILYRIKTDGMDHPVLKASDIPEQYELKVTFKPDLPQDELRNAQIASTLQGLVSDEWNHTNILGISDSGAMRKQIFKEQIYKALMAKVADPASPILDSIVAQIFPQPPAQNAPTPAGGAVRPTPTDPTMMQGQPNMEAMPQTDPMIPPQERM